MEDVYDFLYNVNNFLVTRGYERLEETLSGATFSGLMSELVVESLGKHSATMEKNAYHNGRPDLIPRGLYGPAGVLRGADGVEVKASRNKSGWQGHNVESGWIMIFQYGIDLITEPLTNREPTTFERVLCTQLEENDWSFSGRSASSRRTITASILRSGAEKLAGNPIYLDPSYAGRRRPRHQ